MAPGIPAAQLKRDDAALRRFHPGRVRGEEAQVAPLLVALDHQRKLQHLRLSHRRAPHHQLRLRRLEGDRRTRQAAQGRLDKHGGHGHPDVRAQARDAVAAHCKPASGPNCRCGEPGPPPRPSPLHALPPLPPRRGFRHPVPCSSPSELRASLDGGPAARPRLLPLLLACGRFATDGTASRRRTLWATARRVARRWTLCFSPRACRG